MSGQHVAATTPYPWPWDGVIEPARTALVVVGAGDWGRRVPDDASRRERLDALRSGLRGSGVLGVVVTHGGCLDRYPPVVGHGAPVVAGPDDVVVDAAGLDGFFASALDVTLRRAGRTDLVLCGLGAESTVHSTMRSANDRGFECLAVLDASPAHIPAISDATRSSIEMSGGIFGAVGTTAAVLAAFALRPAATTVDQEVP